MLGNYPNPNVYPKPLIRFHRMDSLIGLYRFVERKSCIDDILSHITDFRKEKLSNIALYVTSVALSYPWGLEIL